MPSFRINGIGINVGRYGVEPMLDVTIKEGFTAAVDGLRGALDLHDRECGEISPSVDDRLRQEVATAYFKCLSAAEQAAMDSSEIPADLTARTLRISGLKQKLGL